MSASLLLQIAVKVSILLAIVWLTTHALRRSSASVRHFIWTIAILAVLLVPAIVLVGPAWTLRVLPARAVTMESDTTGQRADIRSNFAENSVAPFYADSALPRGGSVEPLDHSGVSRSTVTAPAQPAAGEAARPVVNTVARALAGAVLTNWQPLLVGLWAAGVTFVLLRLGIGILWVCWVARRAETITDPTWLSTLEEVSATLHLKSRVSLRRSDRTTVPVACGIWRPILLMPIEADEWSADRRRVVLLHELAHVKRGDCRLQAIAQVAYAWHWFNPLVHLAVARLRAEQERACDDLVLTAGTDGPVYADHLFEIARSFRSDGLSRSVMLTMATPSQLEGRVLAILDMDQRRQVPSQPVRTLVATVVAVAAVMLGAFRLGAPSSAASLTTLEAEVDGRVVAADTQTTDVDPNFDDAIASPPVDLAPAIDTALPGLPAVAAQGPDPRPINPWVDLNLDHLLDFVPPVDIDINIDPNPDPDFDFHFDFDSLPGVGFFGAPGAQAPADGVPDETRRRVADALSSAINDENPRVREQAIQGLAAMHDPRAVPALVKALQSRDVRLRRIAVNSLGQFDTPEAAQGLIGALKDENADVRRVAIAALSRRRDDKYADAIVGAMKDADPDVRRQAVAALARTGQSPAVVGALVQALKDPSADVRERAAGSLGRVRSTEAVPALIAALKDANTEVRQMSAIALGAIADARAIDALTAALKDTDPEVREHAARALSRIARGQRRWPGRFPVADLNFKNLEREVAKVDRVEMEKVHKHIEKVYQNLESHKIVTDAFESVDPREMVDAAMREADKAFKQYEESWRRLEQSKGWSEPETGR